MGLLTGLLVAVVAHALVRAHHVLADAVRADAAGSRALVNVWQWVKRIRCFDVAFVNRTFSTRSLITFTRAAVRCELVTGRALAAETSGRVDAPATAAQAGSSGALVNICLKRHLEMIFHRNSKRLPMQICIIIVLSKPSSQSQVKLPLVF